MSEQLDRILIKTGKAPDAGHELLNEIEAFVRRFCVFPGDYCYAAVSLWAAHAHMVEHFYTTPRLAIVSPELGSGKTRVLEILDLLVPESMFVFNVSPAGIFRSLAEGSKTLLFDETDTIWGKRGSDDNHEDLRALINAGYKRGATIPRCTGPNHEVTHFDAFCAVALAGIGDLPDTIRSRSVIIKMLRRSPNEYVEPFRSRRHAPEGQMLQLRLANWATQVGEEAGDAWPEMPEGVVDRNEEVWEPLIAVADQAGGEWPEKARTACLRLIASAQDQLDSLGIRLLTDLRTIFLSTSESRLSSSYLIDLLVSSNSELDDDAPWEALNGNGINPRTLALMLREYGIKPKKMRIGDIAQKGYSRDMFEDAWSRYLPSIASEEGEQGEQDEYSASSGTELGANGQGVHGVPDPEN